MRDEQREMVWVVQEKALNSIPALSDMPVVFGSKTVEAFWKILGGAFFTDRAEAENDPTHKQIIPYNVICSEGKFLTYQRSGGSEARLDAKNSIGIGGHINPDDSQTFWKRMVFHAALREIDEELVYVDGKSHFPASSELYDKLVVKGVLYDESDEVGKVHLGLITQAYVEPRIAERLQMLSEGKNLRWLDLDELYDLKNLEGWSRLIVTHLMKWKPFIDDAHKSLQELAEG